MTRRKKGDPAAERVAAAIMEGFSPKTAEEAQEALRSVFGPMIETMLKAELEAHLGYPDNDKGPKDGPNRRNGYTRKVVRTSAGEVPIDVPRDRDATFEPAVVPKGERDLTGIESRVMSMYARGMSQRDIAATVREIYGFSMSAETVSAITDRVWEELERWRSRPLEPVYAFMFVDCLYVPVRRGRGARSMAVYAIVAYDLAGRKDVLGLWMQETEGAHHWMGVFDELRQRGVEDVLFVSMDGVSGLADGLRAIFPDAVAQRCLVHLVRNSCKYVPSKDMQAFCRDARAFYGAPSLSACRGGVRRLLRGVGALPGRGGDVGALDGRGRAAVLLRPRRQEGHVHHQRRRERERQLPQGRQAGVLPRRGRRDEAALPAGEGAVFEVGRGMPPAGLGPGAQPAAVRRGHRGEDREVPVKRLTQAS